VFTTTAASAPSTPTGAPYSVVEVTGSAIRGFYVANSSGIYQYMGAIVSGNP
jgi:hypothetical protein